MIADPQDTSQPSGEDRVDEILGSYIERLNAGEMLDREAILREHPDLASEILEGLEMFQRVGAAAAREIPIGNLGDYRLLREIGRGGMGVVYEAWQNSMQRRVALKVLPAGVAADAKTTARFIREAQVAGKLHHPNVVSVHGMGVEAGTPYYSMEYVEGETLAQILARLRGSAGVAMETAAMIEALSRLFDTGGAGGGSAPRIGAGAEVGAEASASSSLAARAAAGPLETKDVTADYCYKVAAAFAEVAEGLQHAHSSGVTHRDIKPSNLILDRAGHLRILDFGLARLEGQQSLTVSGDLVGTVLYMSPEQAMARRVPVDHRTDVYSLGATLYETMTWRAPFQRKTYQETLSDIIFRDPELPRKLNPRIPKDLETIVLKCMTKDPARRYNTAEALAQDLRRFVRGDPIEARPQSPWELAARRLWRHKTRVAVVALASLLVLVSGLYLAQHLRETHARKVGEYETRLLQVMSRLPLGRSPALLEPDEAAAAAELAAIRDRPSGAVAHAVVRRSEGGAYEQIGEALLELEEMARLLPGRPEAHYYRSLCLNWLGSKSEARAALEESLAADPSYPPAIAGMGQLRGASEQEISAQIAAAYRGPGKAKWVSTWLEGQSAFRKKDWGKAIRAESDLLALKWQIPEPFAGFWVTTYCNRGCAQEQAGNLDGALEDFATMCALGPEIDESAILVARIYERKGDRARADARLREFHEKTSGPDQFALSAAEMYQGLGDPKQALLWADRAAPSCLRETRRAWYLAALGSLDEALTVARSAVELDPRNTSAHRMVGYVLGRQKKFSEAVAAYRQAAAISPRDAGTRAGLGSALLEMGGFVEAIEEFDKALALKAEDAGAHNNRGVALARLKRHEEAVAAFRKALSNAPDLEAARSNLRIALRALGKLDEALDECKKAVELDPLRALNRVQLALVLSDLGKPAEAAAEYRKAIDLDPEDPEPHVNLAAVLMNQGKVEEGIAAARKAIELDPRCGKGYTTLGALLQNSGNIEEGTAMSGKGAELDPESAMAHHNYGNGLIALGRLAEAEREFRSAKRLGWEGRDPGRLAATLMNLGFVLCRQGKSAEAFSEWRQAAALDPKGSVAFDNLCFILQAGESLEIDADLKLLVDQLEALVAADAQPPLAHLKALAFSLVYDSPLKNPARAIECARRAVELTKGLDPEAFGLLAEVQFRGGRREEAVVTLEKALYLPGAAELLGERLEEYRGAVRPDLVSCASIDAALDAPEVLVAQGEGWRYLPGTEEPPAAWLEPGFDDSSWKEGPSGFGYSDDDDATVLSGMEGAFTTVYVRRAFQVPEPAAWDKLIFRLLVDDGCVVYLDGKEVGRIRAGEPGARLPFDAVATGAALEPLPIEDIAIDSRQIEAGRHVVAVQGINQSKDSSDFSLIPLVLGVVARERESKRFEEFVGAARAKGAAARLAYLEGRLLQRAGKWSEAAAKFEEAAAADKTSPEPCWRAAECLSAAGDPASAEGRLRKALQAGILDDARLLDEWFALAAVGLKRDLKDLLTALPEPAATSPLPRPAADLSWALEELRERGAIRINCGGPDFVDSKGTAWGRDRFYCKGAAGAARQPSLEVQGTDDDPLYLTERTFPPSRWRPSYRIPLLPGSYRVTLHFAEVVMGAQARGQRSFAALVEGKVLFQGYEPKTLEAEKHAVVTRLDDGFLDIDLVQQSALAPKISAIEIEAASESEKKGSGQ